MTDTVSIRDAKTHLSRLVDRVEAGEEIVSARRGKPVAPPKRLSALHEAGLPA